MRRRSENWPTMTGSAITAIRCGSMIQISFRLSANQCSCRSSTIFIKIPCVRDLWTERRIIPGLALASGANAHVEMNP